VRKIEPLCAVLVEACRWSGIGLKHRHYRGGPSGLRIKIDDSCLYIAKSRVSLLIMKARAILTSVSDGQSAENYAISMINECQCHVPFLLYQRPMSARFRTRSRAVIWISQVNVLHSSVNGALTPQSHAAIPEGPHV
jgi:hypothetical protein